MMEKTLYVVATPIGNLGDITYRAIATLKEVDLLVCEDTRQTGKIVAHYEIEKKPMLSYHAQTKDGQFAALKRRMEAVNNVAYCTDAGTPGISDPGYRLVSWAYEAGWTVVPLPGPSAITTLISASGARVPRFSFWGFLPHKKGRQTMIKDMLVQKYPVAVYESVHRFEKLLNQLTDQEAGNREIIVGRELTKKFEEIYRGTVKEALEHFDASNTKGEFVVMLLPE
jgi:16S rRNA (cytidine1402-2'-O)-methyltransferase